MTHLFKVIHNFVDRITPEPWLGAILLIIAAVVLGFAAQWALKLALKLTGRTKTEIDEKVLKALHAPVVQTVVLFGLYLAVRQFELEDPEVVVTVGRVLITIGLIVWTRTLLRVSTDVLRFVSERADTLPLIEKRTFPLFSNLTVVVVLGGAIYALLHIWNRDVTTWTASAGVLGLAFGFAAKDTLGNLFSGVFIVADAPYQLGDYIVLDNGDRGEVVHIGLRSTRIQTRDDVQVTIPNSVIAGSKIINQSGGGETHMRVRVQVSIGYDADIDKAREVLEEIATVEPRILQDPAPRVRFRRLGDSGLEFELLGWVKDPTQRGQAVDGINTAIIKRFRTEGIEIPYPQRVVHMRQG
jgi:MscS family membrane protein